MVDLIVFEEQFRKYLTVVNNRIIVHRTLYKKGQCTVLKNVIGKTNVIFIFLVLLMLFCI